MLVLGLVRQKRMSIDYSILWIFIAAIIFLLSTWYGFLLFISKLIGAGLPTTTLFIFGTIFLIALNIHYSVRLSELSRNNKVLLQELALLKNELKASTKEENKQNED